MQDRGGAISEVCFNSMSVRAGGGMGDDGVQVVNVSAAAHWR